MKSVILNYHEQLKNGQITPERIINKVKAAAKKIAFTNSIITPIFQPSNSIFDQNNLLSCIPYSLKDNISTEGIITTGGSKFLEKYVPPFNASVYGLLKINGATLVCKDTMDEFGLNGTGTTCFKGIVCNPYDNTKIVGGSSSGSVVNVACGVSAFAIATDTGDSIRRPSSFTGVVGYKPTYGAISRYGVFPYAPSFDHVGIITKYVTDSVIVGQTVIKHDPKDYTSTTMIRDVKLENLKPQQRIKFVVITNLIKMLDENKQNIFNNFLKKVKKAGHEIIEASLDKKALDSLSFIYKTLTYCEGYSCYSNLQGITFGKDDSANGDNYEQSLIKSRSNNIGDEVKKRFIIGTFLTAKENSDAFTLTAKCARHMIQDLQLELLKKGDCILMPSVSTIALPLTNLNRPNNYDDWLLMDNCSGTPSITIPFTRIDNLPWGLTISCDVYKDMKLLNIAYTLETLIGDNDE